MKREHVIVLGGLGQIISILGESLMNGCGLLGSCQSIGTQPNLLLAMATIWIIILGRLILH